MRNVSAGMNDPESEVYAVFRTSRPVVSALGLAFVVALWFASMLFFVRGFVDGATSAQAIAAESGYDAVP